MYNIPISCQTEDKIARGIAKIAIRALYFEVKAYPKPGLVSFIDSGAHWDMNGETFYRSLFTLRHYFYCIAAQGLANGCYENLRQIGLDAERRMLQKTAGVNTHRGAIFALGILCVSVSRMIKEKKRFTPHDLYLQLIKDWSIRLKHHQTEQSSHGAIVRQTYKIVDAKQMARDGYSLVFHLLSSFLTVYEESLCLNKSCLFAYSQLLILVDDTNILYRKGGAGLLFARQKAQEILSIECLDARQQHAIQIHRLFSREGISPGGVADLISVLLFIGQLFCEPLLCHY